MGAALALAVAFGVGYRVGGDRAMHLDIYTGDCRTTADAASCLVGDKWYSFESGVSWTGPGASGSRWGWPSCLPKQQDVKGVRFAAPELWVGDDFTLAKVLWVDCRGT